MERGLSISMLQNLRHKEAMGDKRNPREGEAGKVVWLQRIDGMAWTK